MRVSSRLRLAFGIHGLIREGGSRAALTCVGRFGCFTIEQRYRRPQSMTELLTRMFYGGFVRLHVLYHAVREPIYGVEMMGELARHGYDVGAGTLYPMLHQLEEAGYL